jgi:AcrR family transcriptional regulator
MAQGDSTAGLAPAVWQERSLTGDVRMDRAVECAAGLFLKRRIADVRMTDVAEAAGVGVATLYRRFSTKTRLALARARSCGGASTSALWRLSSRTRFSA